MNQIEENGNEFLKFDLPKDASSIIKVIGVGGGGCNAVNHMFSQGILGVNFMICNTDAQVLDVSPIPLKVQLGGKLTEGRGAGANPEVGKKAALENADEIRNLLSKNTKMVFITAGMGGGTGTGAAPVIAQIAKEMGILTVGIVTVPFGFEGKRRKEQAEEGINELKKNVDTLLVISNDKLREIYGNLSLTNAFNKADDVLTTAAKGIAEIITSTGYINVDFEDVKTVMTNGGSAIMGSASAEGENRAIRAIEEAMNSPLLSDSEIRGAKHILLYISFGDRELLMDELTEITDFVHEASGGTANLIFGTGMDSTLGDKVSVTLVATGFKSLDEEIRFSQQKENVTLEVSNKKSEEIIEAINDSKFESKHDTVEELKLEVNDVEFETPPVQNTDKPNDKEVFNLFEEEENAGFSSSHTSSKESIDLFREDDAKEEDPLNDEKYQLFKPSDRIKRLSEIASKIKTPSGLEEMEKTSALQRRAEKDEKNQSFKDQTASNLSVGFDPDEGFKLRQNNSFLHDNVD